MNFDLALGRGQFEDQHVLGQPALVARHRRGDPQREALLAEQGVAAVARAVGPDFAASPGSGRCTCCPVAGPGDVFDALGQRHADRVHAGDELAVGAEHVEGGLAHPGHDPHGDRDVGRVGQLDADFGDSEPSGPIEKGTTYIVRPTIAALEEAVQLLPHLGRVAPVVGRAGVVLVLGADEGAVFDPGDVGGVGEGEVGVRPLGVGEALEGAGVDQGLGQGVVLLGGAVAPVDGVGLGQGGDLTDPGEQLWVGGQRRGGGRGQVAHSPLSVYFFGLRPTRLTSASLLRIFKVAVACLPSEKITVQVKVCARLRPFGRRGNRRT